VAGAREQPTKLAAATTLLPERSSPGYPEHGKTKAKTCCGWLGLWTFAWFLDLLFASALEVVLLARVPEPRTLCCCAAGLFLWSPGSG